MITLGIINIYHTVTTACSYAQQTLFDSIKYRQEQPTGLQRTEVYADSFDVSFVDHQKSPWREFLLMVSTTITTTTTTNYLGATRRISRSSA